MSIGSVFWESRAQGAKCVEDTKPGSDVFYPLCLKLLRPLCRLRRMCAFVGDFSNKPSCKSLFCIQIAMSELRFVGICIKCSGFLYLSLLRFAESI